MGGKKKHDDTASDVVFEEDDEIQEELGSVAHIKKIKEQLKKCQLERGEYLDGWQRAKAELVNLKKELEERHSEGLTRARRDLFERLFPVADSFEMAFQGEAWNEVSENWRSGVEQIYNQLQQVLRDEGVERYGEVGERFDPVLHESVGVEEGEDGAIVRVLQKGYRFNGTVLRPARVIVAKSLSTK